MERLTHRDIRALLDFLGQSYALKDFDGFVAHVLTELPKLVPAELLAYSEMNPRKAKSHNRVNPAVLGTPQNYEIFQRYMHESPVLRHNTTTGDGQALMLSDFCSRRQFHRTGLYNEFFRAIGTDGTLNFTLACTPPRVIGIGLHRAKWHFSERERLLANLLRPHLIQAWHNAKIVSRMQEQLSLLGQTLETLDCGVAELASAGQVRSMNARARQVMAEFFREVPPENGKLPDSLQRWLLHQQRLLDGGGPPPPRSPLVMEREGKRLVVRFISDMHRNLLLFETRDTYFEPETLHGLGLTPREAEVLTWVARGKTNSDIASLIGMSPRTAQKHIERIFQKLGVETRTAAAARALQMASAAHGACARTKMPS